MDAHHSPFGLYTLFGSKPAKEFHETIHRQWGCLFDEKKQFGYLLSRKDKVHLINRGLVSHLDLPLLAQLRIDRPGLYFGELMPGGLRLSIEGSQLVGPLATKNVLFVSDKEKDLWLKGEPLEKNVPESGFVIIAHQTPLGTDFLGCCRVHADHQHVANFIPKTRMNLSDD